MWGWQNTSPPANWVSMIGVVTSCLKPQHLFWQKVSHYYEQKKGFLIGSICPKQWKLDLEKALFRGCARGKHDYPEGTCWSDCLHGVAVSSNCMQVPQRSPERCDWTNFTGHAEAIPSDFGGLQPFQPKTFGVCSKARSWLPGQGDCMAYVCTSRRNPFWLIQSRCASRTHGSARNFVPACHLRRQSSFSFLGRSENGILQRQGCRSQWDGTRAIGIPWATAVWQSIGSTNSTCHMDGLTRFWFAGSTKQRLSGGHGIASLRLMNAKAAASVSGSFRQRLARHQKKLLSNSKTMDGSQLIALSVCKTGPRSNQKEAASKLSGGTQEELRSISCAAWCSHVAVVPMKTMAAFHAQATAASRAAGALPKQNCREPGQQQWQHPAGVMIFDVRSSAAVACCRLFFFVHIFSFRLNSLWSFPVGKFKKLTSEDGMQPPSEPRLQDADGPCDMNGDSLKQLQSTANYWQKKTHTYTPCAASLLSCVVVIVVLITYNQ